MPGKKLTFFGPPTAKWRLFKMFAKLNQNHLLMANIYEYQTLRISKYEQNVVFKNVIEKLPFMNRYHNNGFQRML